MFLLIVVSRNNNSFTKIFIFIISVPIAIGRTALCGEDMYMSGMRGRGVGILHIFKDYLWMLGNQNLQPPIIEKMKQTINELNPKAGEDQSRNDAVNKEASALEALALKGDDEENSHESDEMVLEDEMLKTIFFASLKFKSKEIKLPIIYSTFTKILQDSRY